MRNNKFLSLLKYNAYIFVKTKQIIIFTLIIMLCIVGFVYTSLNAEFSPNEISRDEEIENMKTQRELYEYVVEHYTEDKEGVEFSIRKIQLYDYLIENNYVCSDFYELDWSTSILYNYTSDYKASTLMLYSISSSGTFLFLCGVFMGLFLFGDFYKKNIKNILSSGISKKNFFYTNYLLMFMICFLIGWIIGGIKNTDKILYGKSGDYIIKNIVNIYSWAMLGRFVLAIFVYSLNVLVAGIMNNKKTLIICTLLLTVIILVSELFPNYNVLLPIISLCKNILGITKNSVISLNYHFLSCIVIMILSEKYFEKRDYYDRT